MAETRRVTYQKVEVNLDGDWAGLTVEVRVPGPTGRLMAAFDALERVGEGKPGETARAYGRLVDFLERAVTGWNFEDEEGRPMAYGRETLLDLSDGLLMAIFNAAAGAVGGLPKNSSGG